MKKVAYLLLIYLSWALQCFAQDKAAPPAAHDTVSFFRSPYPISKSIALGYTHLNQSNLFLVKFGYEYKHWGAMFDFQRSSLQKTWGNGLQNRYINTGFTISARYYMREMGRRGFLELGAGNLFPKLISIPADENGKRQTASWKQLLFTWGAGWRIGTRPRGFFGELGYKGTLSFNRILLYVPPPSPAIYSSAYTANGWYIPSQTAMHWLYGALGWSF